MKLTKFTVRKPLEVHVTRDGTELRKVKVVFYTGDVKLTRIATWEYKATEKKGWVQYNGYFHLNLAGDRLVCYHQVGTDYASVVGSFPHSDKRIREVFHAGREKPGLSLSA